MSPRLGCSSDYTSSEEVLNCSGYSSWTKGDSGCYTSLLCMTRLTTSQLFPGMMQNLRGPCALSCYEDKREYFLYVFFLAYCSLLFSLSIKAWWFTRGRGGNLWMCFRCEISRLTIYSCVKGCFWVEWCCKDAALSCGLPAESSSLVYKLLMSTF